MSMQSDDIREEIFKAINVLVKESLSKMDYLFLVEGVIENKDDFNRVYSFSYNGESHTAVSLTGEDFIEGDSVYVLFSNDRDIKKMIVGKRNRYASWAPIDQIPQIEGPAGKTSYTHIAYADSATGEGMSSSPVGKSYMGMYVDLIKEGSLDPSKYGWVLIKGSDGAPGSQGPQGVQGPAGKDGKATYTWIRYADTSTGGGISNSPTGKEYIGLAHNKETSTESNTPTDYTWSLIRGPQGESGNTGVEGPKGKDGKTTYTWIKYSANANGSGLTDTPQADTAYIGIATNKTVQDESSTPGDYIWSLFKGPKGEAGEVGPRGLQGQQGPEGKQGIQGSKGADGLSSYTHIAYATGTQGQGFNHETFPEATYIGMYVSSDQDSSGSWSDYEWTLVKGKDGSQGLRGPEGKDGKTPYFHTAWANDQTGTSGFSTTDSVDKIYIGTATTFESNDPTEPSAYNWTKIKGDKGDQGPKGATGAVGPRGDAGTSVEGIVEYYGLSTSDTVKPTSWVEVKSEATPLPKMTSVNKYLWNYEKINFSDSTSQNTIPVVVGAYGDTGQTGQTGSTGSAGVDGRSIVSIKDKYLVTSVSSGVTRSTSGWVDAPTATDDTNKYLWNYEIITWNKAPITTYVDPIIIGVHGLKGDTGEKGATGVQGPRGATGTSVESVTEYYLATSASSGILSTNPGFTTAIQTMTATNKYLWNYEKINFSDNTSQPTVPVIIGVYGDKGSTGSTGATGRSITGITEHYLASDLATGVTRSTSGWSTTMQPTTESKRYLWNYETITWSSGTMTTYVEPIVIGVHGLQGPKGDTGPKGATGSTGPKGDVGTSVSSVTEYYLASPASSGILATNPGFTTTMQPMTLTNKYLWNYEKINFSDGTDQPTIPVVIGVYGDRGPTGGIGPTGRSIVSVTEHYLATSANTGVTRSTSGWNTTMQPTTETDRYLWNYETVTWSATPLTTYVDPIIIGVHGAKGDKGATGEKGATGSIGPQGATGTSVESIVEYYGLSTSASTKPTSWTEIVSASTPFPVMTATNKYLWNYEKIKFSNLSTQDTLPVVVGVYGDKGGTGSPGVDGRSITSIQEKYQVNNLASGVTRATGTWINTPTATSDTNKYLWNYEIVNWNKAPTPTYVDPIIIGVHGNKGDKGAAGTTISSITEEYYLSTSKTSQTGSDWKSSPPAWKNNHYMWTRSKIVYTNPAKTEWTTPIVDSSWEAVNDYSNTLEQQKYYKYKQDIVVYGESNKFYPVCFYSGDQSVKRDILITRSYSERAPEDWYSPTHKGGLTLKIKTNFGGWGGANYSWEIHELEEMYSKLFAGATNIASHMGFAVMLRGGGEGGAIYHIHSDQSLTGRSSNATSGGNLGPGPVVYYNTDELYYNADKVHAWNAPAPIGLPLTAAQQGEIDKRKFIQLAQKAVQSTDVEYYLSTSATELKGGGWSTTAPTWVDGKYMWSRTKVTLNDGTTSYTPSASGTCIAGAKGATGATGVAGPKGDNGLPTYTWIAYATSAAGANISLSPTGKDYVGYASGQTSKTPSITTPSLYTWQLVKGATGPQGIQGGTGPKGDPVYTWIKYADTPTSGMTDDPTDKKYIGMAYNKPTATESTAYNQYQWSLMPQNIEIGGRNLFTSSGWEFYSPYATLVSYDGTKSLIFEETLGATSTSVAIRNAGYVSTSGRHTMSGFVKINGEIPEEDYFLNITTKVSQATVERTYNPATGYFTVSQVLDDYTWTVHATARDRTPESNRTIEISNIKLERGNVATDWTPAPEDVETAYKAISKAERELAEINAKAYADGVVSAEEERAIADAKAKLDEAKKYVDALEVGGRNFVLGSAVPHEFDEIHPTSTTYYDEVERFGYDLTVGGRNLLEGSSELRRSWETDSHSTYSYLLRINIISILEKVKIGDELTFSMDIWAESETTLKIYDSNGNPSISFGTHNLSVPAGESRQTLTTKLTSSSRENTEWIMDVYNNNNGVKFEFSNVKIEKGDTATEWSPAPEDFNDLKGVKYNLSQPLQRDQYYTLNVEGRADDWVGVWLGDDVHLGYLKDNKLKFKLTETFSESHIIVKSLNEYGGIEKIKLERGNTATDWTPAPEDIQAELDDNKSKIEDIIITTTENSSAITQAQDSIAQEVLERTTQGELILEQTSSLIKQTADDLNVIFSKLEADRDLTNGEIELIQSYFRINENGVIIGKSNSAIEFFAENNRVGFREGDNDIAYWEEGTMNVERLIAITTIMVGYHLIEKYDSPIAGKTTIVRIGD